MTRIKLSPIVFSVFETDVLDHLESDHDDGYGPLRDAFDGQALLVDATNSEAVADSLCELSNRCDASADALRCAAYSRAAASVSGLMSKARISK